MARIRLSRRSFLAGAGVAIGLPFLEAMVPARKAMAADDAPFRFLAYHVPNGINMPTWTPAATGSAYALTPTLQPLAALKDQFTVISGLRNYPGVPDGGLGHHAAATGAMLTCTHVNKSQTIITNSTSVDQRYAQFLGNATPMPSLQLGIEGAVGGCDIGYACPYTRSISWNGSTPLPKLTSPKAAFDLLFAGADPLLSAQEQLQRRAQRLSVLDAAKEDADKLLQQLGRSDQQKLQQYLDSVRELEQRVASDATGAACQVEPGFPGPVTDFQTHIKLMTELMVLAFKCDRTRVISFMFGNSISNRDYSFIGASGGHHEFSHHAERAAYIANIIKIDRWELEQFAYLLQSLRDEVDGDGISLLDRTLVYFTSEVSNGHYHRITDLPILLAGGGGSIVPLGQHLRFNDMPLANLYVTLLQRFGLTDVTSFGDDSTGALPL